MACNDLPPKPVKRPPPGSSPAAAQGYLQSQVAAYILQLEYAHKDCWDTLDEVRKWRDEAKRKADADAVPPAP